METTNTSLDLTDLTFGAPRQKPLSNSKRQIRRRARRAALKAAKLYSELPNHTDTTNLLTKEQYDLIYRYPSLTELVPNVTGTNTAREALQLGYSPDMILEQLLTKTNLKPKYLKEFVKKHTPSLFREINTQGEW